MGSWLSKLRDKQKQKNRISNDPELRKMQLVKMTADVTRQTVAFAEKEVAPTLNYLTNALSNIFCRCILSGFFKVADEQIEQFFLKYTDRSQSVDLYVNHPNQDKGVSIQEIVDEEIRSTDVFNRPVIGWQDYSVEQFVVSDYAKKVPMTADKKGISDRSLKLWSAGYAQAKFMQTEIIFLSVINDLWQWSRYKCQLFVALFRNFQYIDKKDVYFFIDWLEKNKKVCYKDSDMRLFKKNEGIWEMALRIR